MVFYENLEEIIFHRHEMFDVDELVVLSGYVGPKPIERLKTIPLKTSVIYGMYGADGIGEGVHGTLLQLERELVNTEILYSQLPVHAKCYVWKKNGKIVTALVGSANFSISGLSNPYKEVLAETTYDTSISLNAYIEKVLSYCKKCSEITIDNSKVRKRVRNEEQIDSLARTCKMSLLNRSGEVSEKSGLNWGRARLTGGHTSKGDAYIAITKEMLKKYPNLFPPKQGKSIKNTEGAKVIRQNDAVEYIWDDGFTMEGLLEGTQEMDGIDYPKNFCSGPSKNALGIYLRKRMGIKDLDYQITKEDLVNYGRTDITITLQGEGVYELDFSV